MSCRTSWGLLWEELLRGEEVMATSAQSLRISRELNKMGRCARHTPAGIRGERRYRVALIGPPILPREESR